MYIVFITEPVLPRINPLTSCLYGGGSGDHLVPGWNFRTINYRNIDLLGSGRKQHKAKLSWGDVNLIVIFHLYIYYLSFIINCKMYIVRVQAGEQHTAKLSQGRRRPLPGQDCSQDDEQVLSDKYDPDNNDPDHSPQSQDSIPTSDPILPARPDSLYGRGTGC